MGVYDILPGGQQVECWWRRLMNVKYNQAVLPLGKSICDYSITLREGGYANVDGCTFMSVTKEPMFPNIIFDKWGNKITKIEEGYLFSKYYKDSQAGHRFTLSYNWKEGDEAMEEENETPEAHTKEF